MSTLLTLMKPNRTPQRLYCRRSMHAVGNGSLAQHLFRSATLRKLSPPADSSTLSFMSSFSFFLESSKSSCGHPSNDKSLVFVSCSSNSSSNHVCHQVSCVTSSALCLQVRGGVPVKVDGVTWSFHLVFQMKSEVYLPPRLVKST